MNNDLERKLFNDFPLLYGGHKLSIRENLMSFGFEHDSGWYDIIYQLSLKLEPMIRRWIEENEDEDLKDDYPMAVQVKEKFGGLSFYMTFATVEMAKLISEAESESYKTCESCGSKENVFQTSGWITTTCNPCETKRQEKRKKLLDK
ncbi:MAG: hypothetical protein Q8P81_03190 [Nanoarchaeota archaeon]|nr:hypothetical protein [Nanoarchaeota archaeon]